MGNKRWVHRVLKSSEIKKWIAVSRQSLRIEVYDGSPHLQIFLSDKGKRYFKTLGRVRNDIFKKYDLTLMETQSGYVNVVWYKFKEVQHGS